MINKVNPFINKILNTQKKAILKTLLVFMLGLSLVSGQTVVYANGTATTQENATAKEVDHVSEGTNILSAMSSAIYFILWPLVALAGLAMDNTLVYGSAIGLDTYLWKIWQIVRTFANLALGLIFLVGVLMYNLSPGGKMAFKLELKSLIKKTLVASVLIQASWFLVMAAVDISTILIYGLGDMASMVANSGNKELDRKILKQDITFNGFGMTDLTIESTVNSFENQFWHTGGSKDKEDKRISPCQVVNHEIDKNSAVMLIIGRKFLCKEENANKEKTCKTETTEGLCVFYGTLFSFREVSNIDHIIENNEIVSFKLPSKSDSAALRDDYQKAKETAMDHIPDDSLTTLINAGVVIPINSNEDKGIKPVKGGDVTGGGGIMLTVGGNNYDFGQLKPETGCKNYAGSIGSTKIDPKTEENQKKLTLQLGTAPAGDDKVYECVYKDVGDEMTLSRLGRASSKTVSTAGVFSALYQDLFNFAEISTPGLGVVEKLEVAVVNFVFAIMLVVPLFALVIVLFIRIGMLWIVIAASPFLVLINVFDGVFEKISQKLGNSFSLSEIIKLLVTPVLFTFAVSLAMIFMTALKSSLGKYQSDDKLTQEISGINIGTDGSIQILNSVKIAINNGLINVNWLIIMFLGVGLTRFLLDWAIKFSKIGADRGGKFMDLAKSYAGTIPIIPLPGGGGIGFNAISQIPDVIEEQTNALVSQDRNKISKLWEGSPSTSGSGSPSTSGSGSPSTSGLTEADVKAKMDEYKNNIDASENNTSVQAAQAYSYLQANNNNISKDILEKIYKEYFDKDQTFGGLGYGWDGDKITNSATSQESTPAS